MRSIKINSIIILSFLAVAGCKRDIHEPLSKNTTPPGVVSNVSVVNQHGKATLNYKLPAD
jgi:hypothetical protein